MESAHKRGRSYAVAPLPARVVKSGKETTAKARAAGPKSQAKWLPHHSSLLTESAASAMHPILHVRSAPPTAGGSPSPQGRRAVASSTRRFYLDGSMLSIKTRPAPAAEESATRTPRVVCLGGTPRVLCFRTSRRGGNTLRASPNAVDATPQRTRGHK